MAKLILKTPLVLSEKTTIAELNFREHTTAADYLNFDIQGGVAQMQQFIADFTGTEVALVRRLSGKDYLRAKRIIDELLDDDFAYDAADTKEKVEKK